MVHRLLKFFIQNCKRVVQKNVYLIFNEKIYRMLELRRMIFFFVFIEPYYYVSNNVLEVILRSPNSPGLVGFSKVGGKALGEDARVYEHGSNEIGVDI